MNTARIEFAPGHEDTPLTEAITWTPVAQALPDADITVLVALAEDADEPTWLGFYDDSFDEGERWRDVSTGGPFARRVVAWTGMPGGPAL